MRMGITVFVDEMPSKWLVASNGFFRYSSYEFFAVDIVFEIRKTFWFFSIAKRPEELRMMQGQLSAYGDFDTLNGIHHQQS